MKEKLLKILEITIWLGWIFVFSYLGYSVWMNGFPIWGIACWVVAALILAIMIIELKYPSGKIIPSSKWGWLGSVVPLIIFVILLIAKQATVVIIMFGVLISLNLISWLLRRDIK